MHVGRHKHTKIGTYANFTHTTLYVHIVCGQLLCVHRLTTAQQNYTIVKGLKTGKQHENLKIMWCSKYERAQLCMYALLYDLTYKCTCVYIYIYIYINIYIHLYVLEATRAQFHMGFNLCGLKNIWAQVYMGWSINLLKFIHVTSSLYGLNYVGTIHAHEWVYFFTIKLP